MPDNGNEKCSHCGLPYEVKAEFCGNCGYRIGKTIPGRNDTSIIVNPTESSRGPVLSGSTIIDQNQTIIEPLQTTDNLEQIDDEEHWVNLRWFIFLSAALYIVLLPIGFFLHVQALLTISLFLCLTSLILSLFQSSHFNQWYWFTCILLLTPLSGIIYGSLNPTTRSNHPIPPKQLVLVTSSLGLVLLIVSIIYPSPIGAQLTGIIISAFFMVAGSILMLIRIIKLREEDWIITFVILFPLAPLLALFYSLSTNKRKTSPPQPRKKSNKKRKL
jgi:hypothetical protein